MYLSGEIVKLKTTGAKRVRFPKFTKLMNPNLNMEREVDSKIWILITSTNGLVILV